MAEESESTVVKKMRPRRRLGRNLLAAVQVAFLLIAVVAVNYLSFHQFGRVDLSRSKDYTISPATKSLLKTDAIAERAQPVRWILCFRRTSPFYERIRAMAEEYARLSGGAIELETVDSLRSPDRMQEVAAAYGLTFVRDLLVMDARTDDAPAVSEDANQIKSLHPNIRLVLSDDFSVHEVDGSVRKISAFRGEEIMTSKLMEAVEGRLKRIGLLADKTRFRFDADNSPLATLAERMRLLNVELVPMNIAAVESIPEGLDGLVIAAPSFDFTEPEIKKLERYWQRPRAGLLVLCDSAGVPPRLKGFLRAYGITPHKDRVVRPLEKGVTTEISATFARGIPFLAGLAGQSTTWHGASASLEVREGAEDLLARKIYPMAVVEASPDSWGETRFGSGKETFDETEDYVPQIHLAAISIRGAESDDRFAESTSRMVVLANTDFLNPGRPTRAENLDFLHSATQWLVGREAPIGIGPRPVGVYRLPLLDAQVSFINRVNLIFLPLALLLLGGFVWSSRRV